MHKFSPGDRVVIHRQWQGPMAGTVIMTKLENRKAHHWTGRPILLLHVIFDDGSKITAEAGNFWHEDNYDPDIPF